MATKLKDEYNKYGNVIQTATNDLIDAENATYEQLRRQNEQLERQRQADTQANIKTFTDYLNQGYNADQAMLMAAQQNTVNAQKEAKQQVDADRKAAKWTGLTELAASIANLVGVGQGAVSQNYRQYSQDWMQKADRDMHYHRARIDNLKERQRALQQRQQQIKLQNNLTLAQMQAAARKESTDAQQRLAEQQAAHARNIAGLQYKGTQAAAEAALQGGVTQAKMDQADAHQRASLGAQAAARAANMRAAGRNPDGTINERYIEDNLNAQKQMSGWKKNKDGKWMAPATGADDMINFRVSSYATPEGTLPAFDVHVSASRLNNSILASINDFTDVSSRQKREIEQLINSGGKADDIAKKLMTYIGPSKQMREFVKELNNELKEEEPEEVEPPKPEPRGAARDTTRFNGNTGLGSDYK